MMQNPFESRERYGQRSYTVAISFPAVKSMRCIRTPRSSMACCRSSRSTRIRSDRSSIFAVLAIVPAREPHRSVSRRSIMWPWTFRHTSAWLYRRQKDQSWRWKFPSGKEATEARPLQRTFGARHLAAAREDRGYTTWNTFTAARSDALHELTRPEERRSIIDGSRTAFARCAGTR